MTQTIEARRHETAADEQEQTRSYLTILIGEQRFGIPILLVQDVLGPQRITRIPLSPPEIAGALNLRGRIVTAIDLRRKLGVEGDGAVKPNERMSVVVEHKQELYSFLIDQVGDVMSLKKNDFEKSLPTLDPAWRDVSDGIYRLDGELLIVLDIPKLIETVQT